MEVCRVSRCAILGMTWHHDGVRGGPAGRGQARSVQTTHSRFSPPPSRDASARGAHQHSGHLGRRLAVAVGLADVRREPDEDAELVTQARLGMAARAVALGDGWMRVRLPDYEGWMRATDLESPARGANTVAVVRALWSPLYADERGDERVDEACVSTVLPLASESSRGAGERVEVRLPGGRAAWLARSDVVIRPRNDPFPAAEPSVAVEVGRSLLGVPYLWGGTSPRGVDCSGLVQLGYRVAGCVIPRDGDQQFASIPYVVEQGDRQLGDLVFFAADGRITHVAFSLGGARILHASGSARCVTINSLDRADADYSARLASMYAGTRRPMPAARVAQERGMTNG